MGKQRAIRGVLVLVVSVAVVTGAFSGVAAAETRASGSIVVADGETVSGLSGFGGTIIVRGTVDGDLEGVAGSVVIERSGAVTGDLSTSAGSITIAGEVNGDVEVGTGSFTLAQSGVIGGNLDVGAGSILVQGQINGNARLGGDSIRLAETARIGGDVEYAEDATFTDDGATVGGSISAEPGIGTGGFDLPTVPSWLFTGYAMLVNLLLGAVLLGAMPGFSRRVTETVADKPAKAGGVGVLGLFGIPIGLALLAVTIVGIPLSIAGAVTFGLLAWIALLYGRIAVAAWGLHQADIDSQWIALVVGIVGFGLLGRIPILGGLLSLATFLLGLGAIALVLVERRRKSGDGEESEPAVEPPTESGESGSGTM